MRNEIVWLGELGARHGKDAEKGRDGRHGKYGRYGACASGVVELSL